MKRSTFEKKKGANYLESGGGTQVHFYIFNTTKIIINKIQQSNLHQPQIKKKPGGKVRHTNTKKTLVIPSLLQQHPRTFTNTGGQSMKKTKNNFNFNFIIKTIKLTKQ